MQTFERSPRPAQAPKLIRRSLLAGVTLTWASGWLARDVAARSQAATPTPDTLAPPLGATYVGRTSDPETFVAIVLLDGETGEAVGYLCAGPDLSLWFTGHVQAGALTLEGPTPSETATPEPGLTLTEPAPTLVGQLGPEGVTGEARLPNLTLTFLAVPAAGIAGLYLAARDESGMVRGAASTGATLEARQVDGDPAADAPFLIAGTATLPDGTALEITIPAHSEGAADMRWVVLADGAVRGVRRRRQRDSDGDDFIDKTIF